MVKRILSILFIFLCILLVFYSKEAMQAARTGLTLWRDAVFPALFPFFIGSGMLFKTGMFNFAQQKKSGKRSFLPKAAIPVFLIGSVSGTPSGARMSALLVGNNSLSPAQADRLTALCNLASPMFMIGSVSSAMLGSATFGIPIAIGHYSCAFLLMLITFLVKPLPDAPKLSGFQNAETNMWKAFTDSLFEGMLGMVRIGGMIIFFMVLIKMVDITGILGWIAEPISIVFKAVGIDPKLSYGIATGLFEMTQGCAIIAAAESSMRIRITLCSFLVAFGGFCVLAQSKTFLDFKSSSYIFLKLLHAVLASAITYLVIPLCPLDYEQAFAPFQEGQWQYNAVSAGLVLASAVLGLSVIAIYCVVLKRRRVM